MHVSTSIMRRIGIYPHPHTDIQIAQLTAIHTVNEIEKTKQAKAKAKEKKKLFTETDSIHDNLA